MKDYEKLIDVFANQIGTDDDVAIEYRLFYDKKKRAILDVYSHKLVLHFTKKGNVRDITNYQ